MDSLLLKSRIPEVGVCGFKAGKIKLFWNDGTRSDRKYLKWSHSKNMWKGVSQHKLPKEHSGDDFITKAWSFY